jgi:radical SAM protein with 4Fe4S-binding SPASM domain
MRWLKKYQDCVVRASNERPRGPASLLLQWHITDRCNLRCGHCYQETYRGVELTFPELIGVVEQYEDLLAAMGLRRGHINVTGGEPFMRVDAIPLLETLAARRDRFSFAILSNGSFVDKKMAARLRDLRPAFVQVSIEGGKNTHDRIRGTGDFGRVLEALECLRREKIKTYISFTAHRDNYREFAEVAETAARFGVARLWTDRLVPVGGGAAMADKTLSPEETKEFFGRVRDAREKARRSWLGHTEIAMGRALQFIAGGGEPYHCGAGSRLLAIGADGTLYPCRRLPIPSGNVTATPLAQLYRESPYLRDLRSIGRVAAGCRDCFYVKACRGGLRCLSMAMTGDPFQRDPGCWLRARSGLGNHRPASERHDNSAEQPSPGDRRDSESAA